MERLLVILLIFLSGCSSATCFNRVHVATGTTTPFERAILPNSEAISYKEASYKWGFTLPIRDLAIDTAAGPRIGIPLTDSENGVILGLEVESRLRWARDGLQPYVGAHVGNAYFTERWPDQGTDWGFTLGPTVGVKSGVWFFEYKFWHESNGTKVFGHSKGPNPGYNAGLVSIGIEW